MNYLLAKASTWLMVNIDVPAPTPTPIKDLKAIEPLSGGPGYSAAQTIAGQVFGVFLIIAVIAVLAACLWGVVSFLNKHAGGLKGALIALGVILGCVIIAAAAAQLINWGKAIPLFG